MSNVIGGTGSLTQASSGVLTLTAASTYSGGTRLAAGTLRVGHDSALGTGTLAIADATVLSFAGDRALANAVTLQGGPSIDVLAGQSVVLSGPVADGSSAGLLNKTGGGILVLTGASTHSGGTTIRRVRCSWAKAAPAGNSRAMWSTTARWSSNVRAR